MPPVAPKKRRRLDGLDHHAHQCLRRSVSRTPVGHWRAAPCPDILQRTLQTPQPCMAHQCLRRSVSRTPVGNWRAAHASGGCAAVSDGHGPSHRPCTAWRPAARASNRAACFSAPPLRAFAKAAWYALECSLFDSAACLVLSGVPWSALGPYLGVCALARLAAFDMP